MVGERNCCSFWIFVAIFIVPSVLFGQNVSWKEYDFSRADEVANLYPNYPIGNPKKLADLLTAGLPNEQEKFRSIYKWVCSNIQYDQQLYYKNLRQRKKNKNNTTAQLQWERKFSKKVFSTLLEKQKTICSGYAYLVQELSYHAGLDCKVIHGYGRTTTEPNPSNPNHSWVEVKINGVSYAADPTWSSGVYNNSTGQFVHNFDATYFLVDPLILALNHLPRADNKEKEANNERLIHFNAKPLAYKYAVQKNVTLSELEGFEKEVKRGGQLVLQFESDKLLDAMITLRLVKNGILKVVVPTLEHSKRLYTISEVMDNKGKYMVYLFEGDQPLLSYQVQVK